MKNYPHGTCSRGFTLIELLIVITIFVIVSGQVLPSLGNLVDEAHKKSAVNDLVGAINLARSTAVAESVTVTLCPIDDTGQCTKDWRNPVTAFRDPLKARKVTDSTSVIRHLQSLSGGTWHGKTANRRYFSFNATGFAKHAIGSVLWCPNDKNATKATQVIINMGGRARLATDSNEDGIVEDASGSPVLCP
ncbi:GspH/FimT family pseudopilin [Marinobacter changyiensis]|uniref:GspH/FimT family pseudopilin n=1 Tax=Marinobacter changyiensis TaxID=2604091 RepID=UPI001263FBA1|nr:GspH/FimT family pseudopilin [Marinobacter changyiensis]